MALHTTASALPTAGVRAVHRYLIELRKLLDTPSATAILVTTLAAAPASIPLTLLVKPAAGAHATGLAAEGLGLVAYILPLLAILSITGEWRLRTVLSTYTLDSARTAVLAAKCAALLTVVVAAVVVTNVAAACAAVVLRLPLPELDRLLPATAGMLAGMAGIAAVGAGFGAALRNTPLAIVLYLTLPPALPQLLAQVPALAAAVPYLDVHSPLLTLIHDGGLPHAAASAVALLAWIGVPLTVGFLRNARSDIS